MTHQLYEVWKDAFDPKKPWLVQMPKGIISFKTKKVALQFASSFKATTLCKENSGRKRV